ncbi:MAG TPA: site-2 protease family protein, partial [Aggregatilineaceae bacterium]|nr:site-2 protease family protein [Aggregatilineaceae bacterium]
MNGISIEILLGRLVGLVIGFTLHEWGHAWTAYRLGDNTPYYQGRLTLNPRAHLEPIGIVLALIAGFGWAKPTPINPNAFYPNEKRGLLIVTLAGPMMNLIVALAFGIVIRLLTAGGLFDNRLAEYGIGSSRALTFLYQVLGTVVLF